MRDAPGTEIPIPGDVSIVDVVSGATITARAGDDGSFDVTVPAGTYSIRASSPHFDDGQGTCRGKSDTVVVDADDEVVVELVCSMR